MTDPATIAAIADLADELAPVTEQMINAGSRAETELLAGSWLVTEGQRLTVIWRAMLEAKLGEVT